ncbi:MAG: methionyl-tRNA formyltransferase [bacterium]|nr:methionyl-tRNA formyltransferase [bacterium]
MKNPIIFFGTEDFSAVSLQKLIDENFEIAGIITKPDSKKGRGQKLQAPKVKQIGKKFNIPVLQPQKMSEIIDFVQKFENPVGVLVSFGRIIPQEIIDLFTPAIVNIHPSLLPKYRGPSPIESAIRNGDSKTGVSLMKLSKKMDAGEVYSQEEIQLSKTETARELYALCGKIGAEMLVRDLPKIISGELRGEKQDESKAEYCHLLQKNDSFLQPEVQTAKEAEQQIRAFEIFPKSKIKLGEYLVIVKTAEVVDSNPEDSPLTLKFADGKFLAIKTLITPNGKETTATSFINGYKL